MLSMWSEAGESGDKNVKSRETPREIQSSEVDILMNEVLRVEEEFKDLIFMIEQFSPAEDAILFSCRLDHIVATLWARCPGTLDYLTRAFQSFRAAALLNSETASKLAAVGAGLTSHPELVSIFLTVVIHETYEILPQLERSSNPMLLINAADMMGDYFAAARLSNGQKVHFLAEPLLQYLRALIASQDIRAHHSLATQLVQNGRDLMAVVPQELDELSIPILRRLLSPPPGSKIWLLHSLYRIKLCTVMDSYSMS